MNPIVERLQEGIRALHGCQSTPVRAEHVEERTSDGSIWRGDVGVFKLSGHDRAHLAYAWERTNESGEIEPVVVLRIPPVETPAQAVAWALRWPQACF